MAFHDSDLRRTCDVDASIADLTSAELAEVRVDGTDPIPLLSDLFDRFPDAHFNIDAKSDEAVEPLCDFVRERDVVERVCLASFSQRRVDRMRSLVGDHLMTNMGSLNIARLRLLGRPGRRSHQIAQVPTRQSILPIADRRFIRHVPE